jgi:uncharacterized protein YjiS (DUF1127 family)
MSICTHEAMTNHHVRGLWAGVSETFYLWQQRYRTRQEISRWTDRDLHDVGISWCDIAHEAEKPFWRA